MPGYISISIFNFSLTKKNNQKDTLIFSCAISYILISLVALIRIDFFKYLPNTAIINSGLAAIIGIVFSIFCAILSQRKWFKKLTVKLFHKTLNTDIWRDILDLENGSNLKVYLKNKNYYLIGHLKNLEENGDESWIALSAFAKFDKKKNENYKNEPSYLDRSDIIITVRLSDVEHIEIF